MSRIREAFQIDLPLRALFENPTVPGVAAKIEQIQAGKAVSEEMTEILANLESISDNEAQRLLDGTPLNEEKISELGEVRATELPHICFHVVPKRPQIVSTKCLPKPQPYRLSR